MPAGRYAPDAYQQTQVLGSDPRELVVMLCRALVRNLARARQAIEERDYEAKSEALIRAQRLFSELICSLDTDIGGELAESLRALYTHLQRQLVDVDLQDDLDRLEYVSEIAHKLTDAWEEALQQCLQEEKQSKAA